MTRKLKRDHMNDVMKQMQKMFEDFGDFDANINIATGNVPVDIREEDDEIVVTADMPGVQKDDINLTADEESLEIVAESNEEIKEENEKYMRRERTSRSYMRTINWPKPIDTGSIHAEYNDGVLEVRAEISEDEGTNIEIK